MPVGTGEKWAAEGKMCVLKSSSQLLVHEGLGDLVLLLVIETKVHATLEQLTGYTVQWFRGEKEYIERGAQLHTWTCSGALGILST